jgi:hypothetical protein
MLKVELRVYEGFVTLEKKSRLLAGDTPRSSPGAPTGSARSLLRKSSSYCLCHAHSTPVAPTISLVGAAAVIIDIRILSDDDCSDISLRFTQVWIRTDGRWLHEAFSPQSLAAMAAGSYLGVPREHIKYG